MSYAKLFVINRTSVELIRKKLSNDNAQRSTSRKPKHEALYRKLTLKTKASIKTIVYRKRKRFN